jgi:hypothetical protein
VVFRMLNSLSVFRGIGGLFVGFGWLVVFRGLGSLSLLIQRCKKGGVGGNLFDREMILRDERRFCPTKGIFCILGL